MLPTYLKGNIKLKVRHYDISIVLQDRVMKRQSHMHQIKCTPSKKDCIRLNTNGVVRKHDKSGCGGVIRDSNRTWKGGFTKYAGVCKVGVAEF